MKTCLAVMCLATILVGKDFDMPAEAVTNFELESYLGTWYEIARLDHSFERGMDKVTATYSLKPNGQVRVLNRGYVSEKSKWKSATGVAKFKDARDRGALRVSFFRPFYGGYNVVLLDPDYQWALVAGDSEKYLWILAREPKLSDENMDLLLAKATSLGYDTSKLIYVEH